MEKEEIINTLDDIFTCYKVYGHCNTDEKVDRVRQIIGKLLEQNLILDKINADIQKLRGCSCSCSDGIIDDIEGVLDKYRVAVESQENKVSKTNDEESIEDILNRIKEEIQDNTYFINEVTEKEGIDFETVEKIIDKYKVEVELK